MSTGSEETTIKWQTFAGVSKRLCVCVCVPLKMALAMLLTGKDKVGSSTTSDINVAQQV